MRRTAIDKHNPWKGENIGAFCCDKPQIIDNQVLFAFQKTPDGNGESYASEVFFMRSRNLISIHQKNKSNTREGKINGQQDLLKHTTWETLPLGDHGLQTNRGLKLGEEPHLLQVSGSRFLCFWRTELGFLDSSYSNDYGDTWTSTLKPSPLYFNVTSNEIQPNDDTTANNDETPPFNNKILASNSAEFLRSSMYFSEIISNHNVLRNPRGAVTPIKLSDDYFALLFYNNGHTDRVGYVGRLLYWLILGIVDKDTGCLKWSEPEIVLWWDGILLDKREDWNEDWAIVDGAGYADFQELQNGNLALVESNKLTVRYHEIDVSLLTSMKKQLTMKRCKPNRENMQSQNINLKSSIQKELLQNQYQEDIIYTYIKDKNNQPAPRRAPVLPDLRSGGGFTLICCVNFKKLLANKVSKLANDKHDREDIQIIITGLSTVSGALDEAHAMDITKGYEITFNNKDQLRLLITDGFKNTFHLDVEVQSTNTDHYQIRSTNISMVSFIVDGGPKVATCVINDCLYNAAPCGWKFFPREFGEIGGSNIDVDANFIEGYMILDRALGTSACIDIHNKMIAEFHNKATNIK